MRLDSQSANDPDEEKLRETFDGEIVIEEEESDANANDGKRVIKIRVSGNDANKFEETLKELGRTGKQTGLLYQSSLMNLTSTVEWFMSQLLHKYFDAYPDAVGSKDNVFSLNDLKAFGSIEDARGYLVDSRVEKILRASLEEWIEFLRQNANLGMGYLEKHKDELTEIFQRRNLIVHNGGIVNSIYLSKVAPSIKGKTKLGAKIRTSRRYVDNAIDLLEQTFVLVAAELWYRQSADQSEEIAAVLASISFEHLVQERWSVAEGISKFIMSGKGLPEITHLFAKLNYWQAIKWQGRYAEIQHEVEHADFSGKNLVSQLALNALAGRVSEFFVLLPEVITGDMKPELVGHKITYEDLETWPIFRDIRRVAEYETFRQEHSVEFEKLRSKTETASTAEDTESHTDSVQTETIN